uniref:DUF3669 domain-containing protein n=1 Tax=Panagrellus redivivus TaxID=6233 RepID=A0A7E4VSC5_PANRE
MIGKLCKAFVLPIWEAYYKKIMIRASFEVQVPLPGGALCSDDTDLDVPENTTLATALAQVRSSLDINPDFSYVVAKLSYTASGTLMPMLVKETRIIKRDDSYIVTFSDTGVKSEPKPKLKTMPKLSTPTSQPSSSYASAPPPPQQNEDFNFSNLQPSFPPSLPAIPTPQAAIDNAVATAHVLSANSEFMRTPSGKTKCSMTTLDKWYEQNQRYVDNTYAQLRSPAQFPFPTINPYIFCGTDRGKAAIVLLSNTNIFGECEQLLGAAKAEGQRLMRDIMIKQFPNRDYKLLDGKRLAVFFQAWTHHEYFGTVALNHRSPLFCTLRQKAFRDRKRDGTLNAKRMKHNNMGPEASWQEMEAYLAAQDPAYANQLAAAGNEMYEDVPSEAQPRSVSSTSSGSSVMIIPKQEVSGFEEGESTITETDPSAVLNMMFQ